MANNVNIRTDGFLNLKGFKTFQDHVKKKVKTTYGAAVRQATKETKEALKIKATVRFKVNKKTFLNTFGAYIYDSKAGKLASVLFLQKIKWFSIHEHGGTINGKMLLPINNNVKRMDKKKWQKLVQQLRKDKKTFFKRINGNLILFAIASKGVKGISANKKSFKASKNMKRLKHGTAIPIGILVNKIHLKRRYDFSAEIMKNTPGKITKYFQRNIDLS